MTRKEITAFYQAHSRRLFNMSRRILLTTEDAEEVMQDTILKFVTMPFRPMREAAFLEEYALEAAAEPDPPVPVGIPAEIPAARILQAMERLPDPYRLVVTLVLAEGLDYQEIAGYTGMKEATLRSHFLRGKQKLLTLLKEEDGQSI